MIPRKPFTNLFFRQRVNPRKLKNPRDIRPTRIKDLLAAFVGDKRKFDKPVLVTINKENNLHRIGFITQSDLSEIGLADMVVVYFPQSYAFAGDHFLISRDHIKPLNISGPAAMKFIVSGGISGFKES